MNFFNNKKKMKMKFFSPERASRISVGRSLTLADQDDFNPERAARMMRTPLQGLICTHFFEGLRPSLMRFALSGREPIFFTPLFTPQGVLP